MGTPVEKPNFTIYSVDYSEPAVIKLRTDHTPPVLYTLTRDDDIVTLFFEDGSISTLYHKIKPIREYVAELLMREVFGPQRLKIDDPLGVQHKSFWEIEKT
jgi:hypothetical protein